MADTAWAAFTDQAYVSTGNNFLAETASGSGAGLNIPGSAFVAKNSAGRYAAGTTGPLATFHINGTRAPAGGAAPTGIMLLTDTTNTALSLEAGIDSVAISAWLQARAFNTAAYNNLSLNPVGGNVLIGATTGTYHTIRKSVAEGSVVLQIDGSAYGAVFYGVSTGGASSAGTTLSLGKNSVTNRSLNGAGTFNASGADYAEYVLKSEGCGDIAKGDVCGIDRDGKLTRSWGDAHSFVVKSTDPSYVGGDSAGRDLGPRPEAPAPIGPKPVPPTLPEAFAAPMPERTEGEDESAFAQRMMAWGARATAAAQALSDYQAQAEAFPTLYAEWTSAKVAFDTAQAEYEAALPVWEAAFEAERQKFDRIAFSGQVPVNVDAATLAACEAALAAGEAIYLVAIAADDGIGALAVAEADMTLPLYMRRLGKVWAIRDGRPIIDVQHG